MADTTAGPAEAADGPAAERPGGGRPEGGVPTIGLAAETRRGRVIKMLWMLIWLLYLVPLVSKLASGRFSTTQEVFGSLALVAFFGCYLMLLLRRRGTDPNGPRTLAAVGVLAALAVATSALIGPDWLALFVYASVCAASVLPQRWAVRALAVLTLAEIACGLAGGASTDDTLGLALPTLLAGAAMLGLQRLIATVRELREARATIAHLAAADERLRLARDLHDLLGHSLSVITIKSELAGRLLPEHPEAAAVQVADIERVGRQALVDVREAVSGFRRATVGAELAGARTALAAAEVLVTADPELERLAEEGHPRLAPDREGALAWALREGITNVVRHSGATRCRLSVAEVSRPEGEFLALVVADNGGGPAADGADGAGDGNGLRGLRERLLLVDGALETDAVEPGPFRRGGGFLLRALVPLLPTDPPPAPSDTSAPAEHAR